MEHSELILMLIEMSGGSNKKTKIVISGLYKQLVKHFIKITKYNNPLYNEKHMKDMDTWFMDINLFFDSIPTNENIVRNVLCKHTCSTNKFDTLIKQVDRKYTGKIMYGNIAIYEKSQELLDIIIDCIINDVEFNSEEVLNSLNIKVMK